MTHANNTFPEAPGPDGRLLDARLHLLDRQLLDDDGEPVGIVDDLELDGVTVGATIPRDAPPPVIGGILTGKALATRILGGQPPRSRLQPLSWLLVAKVGTVVRLRPTDQPVDAPWVERWLRDHVIARIPGGRHAAE